MLSTGQSRTSPRISADSRGNTVTDDIESFVPGRLVEDMSDFEALRAQIRKREPFFAALF